MGFEIFGVGVPEMLVILVIALIFLGPERLPEAARTVGTWVREIRRMSNEAMGVWQETLQVGDDIRQTVNPNTLLAPPAPAPSPPSGPLTVTYTPANGTVPNGASTNGALANGESAAPGVLAYPAPFEGPAPPEPPKLRYPAPFQDAGETE